MKFRGCVPLSRRDYDIANALHKREYGEELPIVEMKAEYVNTHHHTCGYCGTFVNTNKIKPNYCEKCGAKLDYTKEEVSTNGG